MSNKDVVTNEYSLLFGDCLERMKEIPDASVDMVLTDPPYGTTACKWDSVIPFEPMWAELKRIIKPNGAIVLFGSEPFSSALRMSNIKQYKYDWVWDKLSATNFVHAKNKPMKQHENISVFSLGTTIHKGQSKNRMEYYPQELIQINKKRNKTINSDISFSKRPSHKDEFITTHTNYPKTILSFKRDKGFHPTQKPVALLEYLIKTYTQEGETVLDFTFGSCSTGVACLNTNRRFIGVEMEEKYFDIGASRMQESAIKGEK